MFPHMFCYLQFFPDMYQPDLNVSTGLLGGASGTLPCQVVRNGHAKINVENGGWKCETSSLEVWKM